MLVADGNGLPIGFHLESASPAEVKLAQQTLQTVRVQSRKGQIKTRPRQLVADRAYDRAYDSRAFRQSLRKRGIKACIPARRRPKNWRKKRGRPVTADPETYKQRFKIERSFSWMGNYRRLLIRWEVIDLSAYGMVRWEVWSSSECSAHTVVRVSEFVVMAPMATLLGRPRRVTPEREADIERALLEKTPIIGIARSLKVSPNTVRRVLKKT